jgi:hypothetical protein
MGDGLKKLAIVTCAVLFNILLFPNLALNSESDAELPEWEVGYTWNYQSRVPNVTVNLTFEVIDITDINVNDKDYEVYVVNSTFFWDNNGPTFEVYRNKYISKSDLAIVGIKTSSFVPMRDPTISESLFNPPVMEYDFPLYSGKNWTISYNESVNVVGGSDYIVSRRYNYTVLTQETISVPAGSFECYKVEINNSYGSINYVWYSDNVSNMVKHSGEADEFPFEIELASFSLVAKEVDDEDSDPLPYSSFLLPIIIIAIIVVVLIVAVLVIKKRKKTKGKKKKGKSKRKSKKKKKK